MKRLIAFFFVIIPLFAFAQPSTVYFGNISNDLSIGLGINGPEVTFSIMEVNKSKGYSNFQVMFYDIDENPITTNMRSDTLYHLQLDKKKYAHQQDYKLSMMNYQKLKMSLGSQTTVKINGDVINGAALVGVLQSLENEQKLYNNGQLGKLKNVTLWSLPHNVAMMRFRSGPRTNNGSNIKRGFRYIRMHNQGPVQKQK